MTYYSGFLAAVPNTNKEAYVHHAKEAAALFVEFGALSCVEAWGVDVPDGEVTSFPMAVKKGKDETVVLSWIVWPDKATCDAAWEKMMQDPRMEALSNMPFDGKRLIMGGFEELVNLPA
ncbi:MAG: DUF1428 domain-containing protein [Pseudomonadota bacterium]